MFSDHIQPAQKTPVKNVIFIVGGLGIVCQLVAMVFVAGSQVEKAQARQTTQANFQSAVAACVENSYGAALRKCASVLENLATPLASSSP